MMKQFTNDLRTQTLVFTCLTVLFFMPSTALSWTSAKLAEVDTTIEINKEGPSRVTTVARFEISGGRFHGFDLSVLADGDLIREECRAVLDDGRRFPVAFRKLYDGRTRVLLADGASVKQGAVSFTLVHMIDLAEHDGLREYAGRARMDWTPIIWDHGTNRMTVTVILPGASTGAPIIVDRNVARDYEINVEADRATLTKHRTVRWYPMQVVLDFDLSLLTTIPESFEEPQEVAAVATNPNTPFVMQTPLHIQGLPALMALIGLILMMLKSWQLHRALADLAIPARFHMLPRTGIAGRLFLSIAAAALGLTAQHMGSLAASVPALAIAVSLWLMRSEKGSITPRPGGLWRRMSDDDVSKYRKLAKEYRARRRSLIDISTPGGVVTFLIALCALGYVVIMARENWTRIAWATLLNALIWGIPAWFAHVRSELPVDPTIEGFSTLRRWYKGLVKVADSRVPGADASFWIREDERGTIEVRLRVENPPSDLKGIEVAGEVVRSGSTYRTRKAFILRMEPGTVVARRLAACRFAVEHHLTPDLEEEIIVLRNRRGRTDAGLSPLRAALGMIRAQVRA